MNRILKAEDFFNKFFYASLLLALTFIILGWSEDILFDSIVFVLITYFMFLLAIVMILSTQHWWNKTEFIKSTSLEVSDAI